MRVTEILRGLLDLIDQVEQGKPTDIDPQPEGYEEKDIKRFKQIVDVADTDEDSVYANSPSEKIAGIAAVTHDAGADTWQGTKDADDIRGTTTRIHGNN